jgi:hypothetical protein
MDHHKSSQKAHTMSDNSSASVAVAEEKPKKPELRLYKVSYHEENNGVAISGSHKSALIVAAADDHHTAVPEVITRNSDPLPEGASIKVDSVSNASTGAVWV